MLNNYLKKINSLPRKMALPKFNLEPYSNWLLIVMVFALLNLILLSFSFTRYYEISSDEALLAKTELSEEMRTLNRSKLQSVIVEFNIKRENYQSLKKNRPDFIDPSI